MIDYFLGKEKVEKIEKILERNLEVSRTACEVIIESNGEIKEAFSKTSKKK